MTTPANTNRFSCGHVALSALLVLVLSSAALNWAKSELRSIHQEISRTAADDPLYLPEAKYVKLVTLGFDSFFSKILWFNTVNYFGKQYEKSRDFRWLAHMCDLVTTLDHNAEHIYEFCGTLLSWMAKEPTESNRILTRAIDHQPNKWRFRYLRGFNYWYFLDRLDLAKEDFTLASKLPGAPPFIASLASRLIANEDNPDTAIDFLTDLIDNTDDDKVKDALSEKLKLAYISKHKQMLSKAVGIFEKRYGEKPNSLKLLVTKKILTALPKEPFSGKYYIDLETGEIVSSSGKGLEFGGKTADSGIYKQFEN